MVDPSKVALFIPPGLRKFKLDLFERIGVKIGRVVRHDFDELASLPSDIIPIVGCTPELRPIVDSWNTNRRPWIYWDRGYCRRVFATWLPKGDDGGYYRWHIQSFQMQSIRNVPSDRWDALHTHVEPWARAGNHIVIAAPSPTYEKFHKIEGWTDRTVRSLSLITDRQLVIRNKETKRPLQLDLKGAHCLVTHGSNTAVEAVICGCPVVVDRTSAARLVGSVGLQGVKNPVYPDRKNWLYSLAYSQFSEKEIVDGQLWKLIT